LIQIFFKSSEFYPHILQQQLTTIDFVSYCGGSLGLFLGFSTLSAIEIVYYFSLRFICSRRQNRVSNVSGDEEDQKKNYLVEVIENLSIHGFNQITMKKRHLIERFANFMMITQRFKKRSFSKSSLAADRVHCFGFLFINNC
jgi:hypothetical protein